MAIQPHTVRALFPALQKPDVFLDNPGGTQITRRSLERIQQYLVETNANHGGAFLTSQKSDELIEQTRVAMADFFNASRPEEIVFGHNMTTITMNLSRALARTFQPGDTLVVTRLDHDANISPWLLAAEDRGCKVRWVDFNPVDCTLQLAELEQIIQDERPRLVAAGYASNAVGTINPIPEIAKMAHQAGAWIYVDAVHYTPHAPIDVREADVDFLVCSAYKFFGPHLGILYGRYELLDSLRAYKVRPAPLDPPGKFETGTNNFENIAGLFGALEYFEWLGRTMGEEFYEQISTKYQGRKACFKQALAAIRSYEQGLSQALVEQLTAVKGLKLYGIIDPARFNQRVPTFSFTIDGFSPNQIAAYLGQNGIYTWDGNFYALAVTERLDLENKGGLLRVGAAHYNTIEEIEHLGSVLRRLVG